MSENTEEIADGLEIRIKAAELAAQCVQGQVADGLVAGRLMSLVVFFETYLSFGSDRTEEGYALACATENQGNEAEGDRWPQIHDGWSLMVGLIVRDVDGTVRSFSHGTIGRRLKSAPPKSLRERLAIAIFEAPYKEWWGVATRHERFLARKQADAVMAMLDLKKPD